MAELTGPYRFLPGAQSASVAFSKHFLICLQQLGEQRGAVYRSDRLPTNSV